RLRRGGAKCGRAPRLQPSRHRLRRRARRLLLGARLPDLDDLHPLRRRHQPQRGRGHQVRMVNRRRQRAAARRAGKSRDRRLNLLETSMTTLIKGGTIVAADRSYVADVLIEGETIKAIGAGLSADKTIDAKDCLIMPGGIDPHTHLDMPFMGASTADNYDSGTKAA